MGDDGRRDESGKPMTGEQRVGEMLGLRRVCADPGFKHVPQDGHQEPVQEVLCLTWFSQTGSNIKQTWNVIPANKAMVMVEMINA